MVSQLSNIERLMSLPFFLRLSLKSWPESNNWTHFTFSMSLYQCSPGWSFLFSLGSCTKSSPSDPQTGVTVWQLLTVFPNTLHRLNPLVLKLSTVVQTQYIIITFMSTSIANGNVLVRYAKMQYVWKNGRREKGGMFCSNKQQSILWS